MSNILIDEEFSVRVSLRAATKVGLYIYHSRTKRTKMNENNDQKEITSTIE